ncbi:hypothetical protein PR048_015433 [Dryococelus australis]|uniref:Uncharacterized protein n=1 Tax=Dryococelus australis TaxID=614101 RepID=A0ABQ9HGY9_9NEOP|nr:hypothetical protein PR048_015433 [Dryococelus australis]
MVNASRGHADQPNRPAKYIKNNGFIKPKVKRVSKLENKLKDDFQLDTTNRYDTLTHTDSDKDTDQPEPRRKKNKASTAKATFKEIIPNKSSHDKLAIDNSTTDDTTKIKIPKYMVPIIIDKSIYYNRLISLINGQIGPQYKISFTQQGIKVLTNSTHVYDITKETLKKQNIHLLSFTNKEEK